MEDAKIKILKRVGIVAVTVYAGYYTYNYLGSILKRRLK